MFELTGVAIGLWVATFGVITIVRPASALERSGQPMRPRVVRVIGAAAVLLGLVVAIDPFFVYSEPHCGRCVNGLWGENSLLARLIALLGLLLVFAGALSARRRRR